MSSNNIAFVRNYTSVIDERCQPTVKSVCSRVFRLWRVFQVAPCLQNNVII